MKTHLPIQTLQSAVHRIMRLALAASLALTSSCAYRVASQDRKLPDGSTFIAIPVFKNLTHEAGAEVAFTNAMIREVERNRIAQVVSRQQAQVVLEGSLETVKYSVTNQLIGTTSTADLIPQGTILNTAYSIVAEVRLKLVRKSDGHVIWERQFSGERSYLAPKVGVPGLNSANALYNQSARTENLSLMANDLMNEAHSRLTESF